MKEHMSRASLSEVDPFVDELVLLESERQECKLVMIASESICPLAVRQVMSSKLTNLYAEGYPSQRMGRLPEEQLEDYAEHLSYYRRFSNRRYYKGTEYVDFVESLGMARAARLFANDRVGPESIFANMQPLSGAAANNAVYEAFLKEGDPVMGMDLSHGGHLTHGNRVNRSGKHFDIRGYVVGPDGRLDYEAMKELAAEHRPKLVIAGFSAYPWDVDWERMREVADSVPGGPAILLADIAHTAGLVAAGVLSSPVGYADVVSFTTHKSLCGPRGAMILTTDPRKARKIEVAVFPGEQGGPHVHQMAAKAVALRIAMTDEFRTLMQGVKDNARALAEGFEEEGIPLAYGGTNTHLCLVDLRKVKKAGDVPLTGEIASRILDLCGITCNKNTIGGDTNAVHPSAVRFGTVWSTQRGLGPGHMKRLAGIVANVLKGLKVFEYIGTGGSHVGRAKIDPALITGARKALARILVDAKAIRPEDARQVGYPHFTPDPDAGPSHSPLEEAHEKAGARLGERRRWVVPLDFGDPEAEVRAVKEGCAIFDEDHATVLEVRGERAALLLHHATSADVARLEPGSSCAGLMIDDDGRHMARVIVMRCPVDHMGRERLWVKARGDARELLAEWLRDLSDGYVLVDDDIHAKAYGPAAIEDLGSPDHEGRYLTVLAVKGRTCRQVAGKVFAEAAHLERGRFTRLDDDTVLLRRPRDTHDGFEIILPASRAEQIWSRFLEAGARPAGQEAYDRLGKGVDDDRLVHADKPWFAGQKAWGFRKGLGAERPEWAWEPPDAEPRRTCLYDRHLARTRKSRLVPFAGWIMPTWYTSIAEEHDAVRRAAGLFDVSHMGVLDFRGDGAEEFLDIMTTAYVPRLRPGQARYSYLLDPRGAVIDDILIYRRGPRDFMLIVNAANADEDEAWFRAAATGRYLLDPDRPWIAPQGRIEIRNLKDPSAGDDMRVDLAIQGPRSLDVLARVIEDRAFVERIRALGRFEFAEGEALGAPLIAAATGYTGEEVGFELVTHPGAAPALWDAILERGAELGVKPAALGARDSTRTEAGLPLHGHELAGEHGVNPVEAGYGSFVKLHKPFFVGRQAMVEAATRRDREIVRFVVEGKGHRLIRPHHIVVDGRKGRYAGVVTSCTMAGEREVGMALVTRRELAREGSPLQIFPYTDRDRMPDSVNPLAMGDEDWIPISRPARVVIRFPGEGGPAAEAEQGG
jgi:glycine cleavage system T protein